MSGGRGGEDVSCTEVRAHLYEFMDDEFVDDAAGTTLHEQIRAHLAVCTSCDGGYRFEIVLRRTVRRCCGEPAPPTGLHARILAEIGRADGNDEKPA